MTAPDPAPDRTMMGVAGALSAGAGVIHVGLAAEHAGHHWSMGLAFLLTGWAQLGWAVAAVLRPRRAVLAFGAGLHLAAVAGLLLVANIGWPLAGQPEPVTTAALICLVLEIAVVVTVLSFAIGLVRLPGAALPAALALVVAASSAAVAIGGGHDEDVDGGGALAAAAHGHGSPGADAEQRAPEISAAAGEADAPQGHGHGPVDTTPPTAEQQGTADRLLASSRTALKRYELASVAEAEGYTIVHDAGGQLLHYAHRGYTSDGRTLDPQRIESLLYVVLPGGGKLLVGGMYMMPKGERGPAVGGSLTQWHAHDDLCLDPVKGIAITQLPGGGCPAGSAVGDTGEMMHVWAIDYPGGPFGELDPGALRQAVRDHYGLGEQTG